MNGDGLTILEINERAATEFKAGNGFIEFGIPEFSQTRSAFTCFTQVRAISTKDQTFSKALIGLQGLYQACRDLNPIEWFLEPIPKRFLVLVTKTLEIRVIDTAWNGEYDGAEQLEEGGLGFAEVELGQELV